MIRLTLTDGSTIYTHGPIKIIGLRLEFNDTDDRFHSVMLASVYVLEAA